MARKNLDDAKMKWFPMYPGNLLDALAEMTAEQGYTYTIVLLRIYERWGACTDPRDALQRRTRLPKKKFDEALAWLFSTGRLVETEGGIRSPKADVIMAEQEAQIKVSRERASSGGKRLAEKRKQNQQKGPAQALPKHAEVREVRGLEGEESPSTAKPPDGDLFGGKPLTPPTSEPKLGLVDLKKQLYDQGKLVLGEHCGSLIAALLKKTEQNVVVALAHLSRSATTDSPRGYLSNLISGRTPRARNAPTRNGFAAMALEIMEEERNESAPNRIDPAGSIDHDDHGAIEPPRGSHGGLAPIPVRFDRKR